MGAYSSFGNASELPTFAGVPNPGGESSLLPARSSTALDISATCYGGSIAVRPFRANRSWVEPVAASMPDGIAFYSTKALAVASGVLQSDSWRASGIHPGQRRYWGGAWYDFHKRD